MMRKNSLSKLPGKSVKPKKLRDESESFDHREAKRMHINSLSKGSGIPVPVLKARNHGGDTPVNRMKAKPDSSNQPKMQADRRSRASMEKLKRISFVSVKTTPRTPNLFITPNQNKHVATNLAKYSRSSMDTVRSSLGAKSGKSSWPLNDPSFKSSQMDKLLEFLSNNKCQFSVNRQTLRSPSRKDFIEIFNFIYSHCDSGFSLSISQRYEDQIPKILKLLKVLKYPVQMPKSSFLNVGSPHTWPSVLAMLGWLIDSVYIHYTLDGEELFFPKDFDDDDVDSGEIKIRSLVSFFREGSEDATPFVEEYRQILENAEKIDNVHLQGLNLELDDAVKELESLNLVKDQVKIVEIQNEELCEDKEKILKFNEELKKHLQIKDKEREQLAKTLEEFKEEEKEVIENIKMLNEKKCLQSFSASEINMYKNFKNELTIEMKFLDMEKKKCNEQIWAAEMSIGKCRTKISELVIEYMSLCDKLQLANCRISMSDLETVLPRWREDIQPLIKAETSRVKQNAFEISNAITATVQEKGKLEESIHSMECEQRKMECRLKRLQEDTKHIRKEKAEEEATINVELENLKDEISHRKRMGATPLSELQNQFEEETKECEKLKQKYLDIDEVSRKELDETMELFRSLMRERDRMMEDMTSQLKERGSRALQHVKSILEANG